VFAGLQNLHSTLQPFHVSSEQADDIAHSVLSGDANALAEAINLDVHGAELGALVHGLSAAYQEDPSATTTTLGHALKLAIDAGHVEAAAHVLRALHMAGGEHVAAQCCQ
jgi:hypothetical protein